MKRIEEKFDIVVVGGGMAGLCAAIAAACAAFSASGSGISVTRLSVVSTIAATLAAFCSALLVTLVGSTIPALSISQYSIVEKLQP